MSPHVCFKYKKIKKSGISPRNVKNLTQGCFVCIRSYKAWTYYRSLHFYTFVLWFMSVNRYPMSDADKCFDNKVFVSATNGSEFQLLLFSVYHRTGRNTFTNRKNALLKGIFQPFEMGGVTRLIRSAVKFWKAGN